jgi:subtilisin-like proprotein convertase family protein
MRITTCLLAPLLFIASGKAQTFNSAADSITNNGVPTSFAISVNGLPAAILGSSLGLVEVCLNIAHPAMNELTIGLRSPQGKYVELVNNTGISGSNMGLTCLSHTAGKSITLANAPYNGNYKPIGYLGRFNDQPGNGTWYLIIKDYLPNGNAGKLISGSLRFAGAAPLPADASSSNLPLLFINTNGQSIGTSTILVDFAVVDNAGSRNAITDARNGYNGKCKLNIRGSSSLIFEKKAYKIDLTTNDGRTPIYAPLLGMPAESDWVLTPGYSDKTLLRNALSQHVFQNMGHYSPRTRFVEVFLNNDYVGVYTFLEKPKRGLTRVNVDKLTSVDNSYPYLTGGYIIQINRSDDLGWWSLYPGISLGSPEPKFYYQYVYPNAEEITVPQKNYIKAVMDSLETALNGPNFSDPVKGYRKFIDVDSFVDLFILNEFSKNIDGYKLSTYLYKDNVLAGGKIHCGPAWDYDIAWKNANYGNADLPEWWLYDSPNVIEPLPSWWQRMLQDPYFKDKLYCRWHTFRLNALKTTNLKQWIDENASLLSESQQRNFKTFPILDAYVFPVTTAEIKPAYSDMIADLKDWIQKRGDWMDANMPGYCTNVGLQEGMTDTKLFTSFPNPFTSELVLAYQISEPAVKKIRITTLLGQDVKNYPAARAEYGLGQETLNLQELESGTYILVLELNNIKYFQKIVKN